MANSRKTRMCGWRVAFVLITGGSIVDEWQR